MNDDIIQLPAHDPQVAAAYADPSIDSDELLRRRMEAIADRDVFRLYSAGQLIDRVRDAEDALRAAAPIGVGLLRDLRADDPRDLAEASARIGIGYVAGPIVERDGKRRMEAQGSADDVAAWAEWARSHASLRDVRVDGLMASADVTDVCDYCSASPLEPDGRPVYHCSYCSRSHCGRCGEVPATPDDNDLECNRCREQRLNPDPFDE